MTALLMTFAQNIMQETAMERHSFWLRLRRAALPVSSPDQGPWSSFRFYYLNDSSVLTMDQLA
jgi:hypothetical protein